MMCIMSSPAVVLHLHIRVSQEKREELLMFLRDGRSFYEQPGGITMRLLEDNDDENAFIEVFEYDTLEDYQRDEQRVRSDPEMQAVLTVWRSLLCGPPRVCIYFDRSDEALRDADACAADG
jgi:quinol monooxygenase YgiN